MLGKVVTWKSQAGGSVKEKTGKVIAINQINEDLFRYIPKGTPRSRIKAQQYNMVSDRYIVEVPRKSGLIDYYAVPVDWVEKTH